MAKANKSQKMAQKAHQKKQSRKNSRTLPIVIAGAAIIVLVVAVIAVTGNSAGGGSYVDEATGDLVIDVGAISEKASFHPITVNGAEMEILTVMAPDGTVRTAFNTCQVCYNSGRGYYKQTGEALICQNCGNRFEMGQVGIETGGCNPWPISEDGKVVTDDSIRILADFLEESQGIFANWKTE
ncbi:MAG: DUF2318 domain-containing protein [Clostridiales Family XIII bacterium]|jgi:uncharacterized membrane protein|nr:DUF2318 domain-containing protein [Clostridiales Family XIII bacterium]